MDHIMKRLHYRIGLPGWKVAARVGVPLSFRTYVQKDKEANVYWATSPDIDGLTVEGANIDELMHEIMGAASTLVELELGLARNAEPIVHFDGALCVA
jgi:predicted RNase H-like HicB family nuclease